MKKYFKTLLLSLFSMLALALGANGSVLMASGTLSTDSGSSGEATDQNSGMNTGQQGENGRFDGGMASVTDGQQKSPEQYETDLETTILKLDPYNTVLLTLMSDAKSRKINSQEFEFASVGPRIIRSTVKTAVTAGSSSVDRQIVEFTDKGFCMKDDTIRFVGIPGYDKNGNATSVDLMCIVVDKDGAGKVSVYAKNGPGMSTNNFYLPAIPAGTTVIRMGKSCSETKAQTSRANAAPTTEKGCVQNFMLQIEQSTFDKMTDKRVPWDFDDIVDWNMRDYKITKELSYWFSVGGLDRHEANGFENNYTMQGIWWQAGRDLEIGHYLLDENGGLTYEDSDLYGSPLKATSATKLDGSALTFSGLTTGQYYFITDSSTPTAALASTISPAKVEIDGKDLVRFSKSAFIGNGGSQTKYLLAGANIVEAFDNIKGRQYENKDIVTEKDLTIRNFKTSFGIIRLTYQKLFDICGMANAAFLLDKPYLRGVSFQSLNRTVLKLKETGQRNAHGVVLQEVNAVYLQYADCHARVWLCGRTDVYDFNIASKYDTENQRTMVPPKWGKANYAVEDRQKNDMAKLS